MTSVDPTATRLAGGLDEALLSAKRSLPEPPPSGSVSRASVISSARSSRCRLVTASAPAGYGKSRLLAEWAHGEKRPVAWVSIDRFDDDPVALLTLLASSLAAAIPSMDGLADEVASPGVSPLGRSAPVLASAMRAAPESFVMMIDDLHEVRSQACHDVLGVVLSGIPSGSQVVIASRGVQPEVSLFRASDDAFEIDAHDLALDTQGAAAVFAGAGVQLSEIDAAEMVNRTEGWPVGLHLAAAIARDSGHHAPGISGDDRFVADYLYRESLAKLPESLQRFLRRTAVLDALCAPLCDAILGTTDARKVLRELEESDVFLVALDRRREWFRFHALFREFLLGEMRRTESDGGVELHIAAAEWFEQNGSTAMAIEHLIDIAAERPRVTKLVASATLSTYEAGQLSTLQRWFEKLGGAALEAHPPLIVLVGWAAALTGQTHETARLSALLETASYTEKPVDGSASFESSRAMLRSIMCPRGPSQALADAELAVASEPLWSPWHEQSLFLLGEALLLIGRTTEAAAAFSACSADALISDNTDVLIGSEAELASMAMDSGRWSEANGHIETALAAVERRHMHNYVAGVLAFTESARLAVHSGDLALARLQLTRAMRARPVCTYAIPYLAVRVRLHLARVFWSLRDTTTARHLLREIDDVLSHRPELGVLVAQVSEFRTLMASPGHEGTGGVPPLSPAELRLLPYLQTHLTMREIGERLFISRNTVSSEVISIYRKLGVSARSEAVDRATAMGLLGA